MKNLWFSILKLHKPCQEQIFFHHSMKFGSCIPHNFFRMFRKLFKTSPHRYLLPGKIELAGAVLKTESNSPKSFIIIRVVPPTTTQQTQHLPPTNHTAENNFLDSSYNCSMTWALSGIRPQLEGKIETFPLIPSYSYLSF